MGHASPPGGAAGIWNHYLSRHLPQHTTRSADLDVAGSKRQEVDDRDYTLHHVATKPAKYALTRDPSKEEKGGATKAARSTSSTTCGSDNATTHFLTLTAPNRLHILALELNVYTNASYTTIFIAKADTTGYHLPTLSIGAVVAAIIRAFVETTARFGVQTRICLFARAQPQYIFLGSAKNARKHVLSDRELIQWWMKVLGPMAEQAMGSALARLHIPGAEPAYMRSVLTPPWTDGHIFSSDSTEDHTDNGVNNAAAATTPSTGDHRLAVATIPNFPDDPKSRFLNVLASEARDRTTSVDRFFLELQMRQEFLMGFVSGILGVQGCVVVPREDEVQSHEKGGLPGAVVESKVYLRIHDAIITSDYSDEELARNATAQLCADMPAGSAFVLHGTKPVSKADSNDGSTASSSTPTVSSSPSQPHLAGQVKPPATVTLIGQGLIRKRAKPPRTTAAATAAASASTSAPQASTQDKSADESQSKRTKTSVNI
ncbi:histone acetylation protein-domain-containing protein [Limtongia smithiae]|uniref:histone acetylation protein-domain-containing protein n=1 Tax=Limtongia smithiae TaxID=1125753 RepID=UPI0034CF6491